MRRLILIRHAKAEAGRSGRDFDRRLTKRGRRDAAEIGAVLAREAFIPDLALASTARRAMETWDCASPLLGDPRMQALASLYNAAPQAIHQEIERFADDAATLAVVGHNPGLQELAVTLLAKAAGSARDIQRLASDFPTSTVAVFSVDQTDRFALDALIFPGRHEARP